MIEISSVTFLSGLTHSVEYNSHEMYANISITMHMEVPTGSFMIIYIGKKLKTIVWKLYMNLHWKWNVFRLSIIIVYFHTMKSVWQVRGLWKLKSICY